MQMSGARSRERPRRSPRRCDGDASPMRSTLTTESPARLHNRRVNEELAKRAGAGVSRATVLPAPFVTLSLGYALKAPRAAGDRPDPRRYRGLCSTHIAP